MPPCSPDPEFAAFFRAQFTYVHQNLRRLGVPAAAVEDAAQEVFLVVLRRSDAPITSVRGWLFGIVRRIAWRYRRGASRRERLVHALSLEPVRRVDGDSQLLEREATALLDRFLARLDDDKRAVFVLAELEQQSAGEIASALGIKENTVYSRLRAARQEFDRSCARLRVREQWNVEREAVLSQARRGHTPSPATRERVLAGLLVPGLWGMSSGSASAAMPAAAPGAGVVSGFVGAPLVASLGLVLLALTGGGAVQHEASAAAAVEMAVGRGGAGQRSTSPTGEVEEVPGDRLEASAGVEVPENSSEASAGADVLEDRSEASADVDAVRGDRSKASAGGAQARAAVGSGAASPHGSAAASGHVLGDRMVIGGDVPKGSPVEAQAGGSRRTGADARRRAAGATSTPRERRGAEPAPLLAKTSASDELAREAALVAEARRAIRDGAWAQAQALLATHAREFPEGTLRDERRLSQIVATCASGQVDAARAEVERLAHEQPGLARKAASLCPAAVADRSTTGKGAGD
ncbi:sigma-70 family RNA polymerase sigma factor [Nannocystis sp. SCPEA4]|uniref:RNA polymerase sigma factor n=1 Tax=Nannocystis sp. SCPEA4 TaxID=2996787 RepID=UPI00226D6B16|nr:sigma-70 family RNA polymerase sigma factor [Nannocystis sp. SCPEA4]MCY1059079.1 sigma-70 family RNA polymerase sigma factor [Nannocystis sp. SCPEA4]